MSHVIGRLAQSLDLCGFQYGLVSRRLRMLPAMSSWN
jgi:hypothetical protein